MGKRGPKPQPTAVKKAKGNPGRRPLPESEAEPNVLDKLPRAPSVLDDAGKKHWKDYGKQLLECGLLTRLDLPALTTLCSYYSEWEDATNQLKKTSKLVKTPNGLPMANPYIKIAGDAFSKYISMMREFGMTPSARTGIKVEPKKKDDGDALDNLIKFGKG